MTSLTDPDAEARRRIVTAHGETLFVDAGAGTGKTRQLVERVVSLVTAGTLPEISALAAITFTENAATQLRTRIREALEDAAGPTVSHPDSGRERCRQALARLDDAAITTLHGFAARLLTDAPLEAGLPPGFEVADAVGAALDRDQWWRTRLDEWLDDPGLAPVWRLGLTLGLQPDDLSKLVEPFAGNWDLLPGCSFGPPTLPRIDAGHLLEPLRALAAFAGQGPAGDRMTRQIDEVLRPALREAEAEDDPVQVLSLLADTSISGTCGSAAAWQGSAGLAQARELCQQLAARRDAQLEACRTAVAAILAERLRLAVLDHAGQRRDRGRLWFHDLLVLAVRLLRAHPRVRATMAERWQVILVDEFQDTDPLQVELVHLIAGAGDGSWADLPVAGGRLFFVGDPAQSIYRFRRADLGLFIAARERYSGSQVGLVRNFRCRPGILAAVNATFGELFSGEGVSGHADLYPKRSAVSSDPGPDVLLLGGPLGGKIGEVREVEAAQVAATLRRARAEGWRVTGRDGQQREAGYADMAILVPARTSLAQLEEALERCEIPFRVMSRSLVWESDAVRDLVTVLQAIDDPADSVAVLAALRHPMFACSDDDLVAWRTAGGRWRYDTPVPEGMQTSPVAAAMAALARYHDLRWWLPVNVLLDRIVRERRAVELTAVHRRPRDHWRRIRFLTDQARAYTDSGGPGLTGFIRWAREQIDQAADAVETITPERDDDSVQILTIHSAKGLEFPLVMLTGLNTQSAVVPPPVIWQPPGPPAVRLRKGFETAGFGDAWEADRRLDERESLRLLYVGMTRAADHLLISLCHKPPASGAPNCHAMRLFALLDVLTDAGAQHQPSAPAADPAAPALTAPAPVTSAVSLQDRDRFLAGRQALLARISAAVPVTATGLARMAAAAATDEPADPLVTEDAADTADPVATHPVTRSGATLGSAVHRAMELLDLTAPTGASVERAAAAACGELGVPRLSGEVRARMQSALRSPIVRKAATSKHWKEVPIAATIDGRIIEGVIDLLIDTGEGLVIVDYKTDAVRTEAELHEKTTAYTPQITAYARAAAAIGLRVQKGILCFVSKETAIEVAVTGAP